MSSHRGIYCLLRHINDRNLLANLLWISLELCQAPRPPATRARSHTSSLVLMWMLWLLSHSHKLLRAADQHWNAAVYYRKMDAVADAGDRDILLCGILCQRWYCVVSKGQDHFHTQGVRAILRAQEVGGSTSQLTTVPGCTMHWP